MMYLMKLPESVNEQNLYPHHIDISSVTELERNFASLNGHRTVDSGILYLSFDRFEGYDVYIGIGDQVEPFNSDKSPSKYVFFGNYSEDSEMRNIREGEIRELEQELDARALVPENLESARPQEEYWD